MLRLIIQTKRRYKSTKAYRREKEVQALDVIKTAVCQLQVIPMKTRPILKTRMKTGLNT